MKKVGKREQGVGHIGIFIVIIVLAAAGGIGYFVWKKNHDKPKTAEEAAVQTAIKNAKCTTSDKDLCKFFKSTSAAKFTSMNSTTTADGKTSTMTMQTQGTDKSHLTMSGEGTTYEVITIGNTTYTKDASGTWWKQTTSTETSNLSDTATSNLKTTFQEPTSTDTSTPQTTYKKIGTEKCGKLTCIKYQVVDPTAEADTTQYLWFDNKDFQLRRVQYTSAGTTTDATFSYDNVTINVPSPVKDLAANQYIVPGQSEPVTIPTGADSQELQNLINQSIGQ
ncbi:MAG TPA: hypothetical protein VMR45_00635 [Patescibacteria group bacterium]|nr:hypothetical protein [Patescibacteria group bacterium]